MPSIINFTTTASTLRGMETNTQCKTTPVQKWCCKNVDWKFVFAKQHYGSLIFTLFPLLALGLVLWAFDVEPELDGETSRIIVNQDFDNAKKSGSVPAVVAVLVPFFFFFFILCIGELWVFKTHHGEITNAVYTILYFFINWFCAFSVHIFCQQISAIAVAEPRPDFVARCQPDANGNCTKDDDDGLRSFFSGHASSTMLSAIYCSIYLLWIAYFRCSSPSFLKASGQSGRWYDRVIHEICHAGVLYLISVQLGFAWVVGTSRIIDNRHHVWDVTAGYFVGTIIAAFFSIQAIGALPMMPKKPPST